MKYQTQKRIQYDAHSGAKTATHAISWVRTSIILVLSASMMAVALYQMGSYTGILPGHSHMSSSSSGSTASGKIFNSDERLRGRDRLRIKKETHYHLHVHNSSERANTGAANTNTNEEMKDEITDIDVIEVHQHFNNETAAATEEDSLDELETYLNEVTVDEVELEHEELHENKVEDEDEHEHEDGHELDQATTKEDSKIIVEEVAFLENGPNISVEFTNDYHLPVHVNWMNQATGDEKNVISTLHPNESKLLESHPGHTFVAFDDERSIRNIFTVPVSIGNRNLEDGNVEFRVALIAMQEEEQHDEPESSHLEGKPASAPKSVAEPELAHQLEQETKSEHEPESVPEPVHQEQQLHNLINAIFINEYHESMHVNWINPKTDEEKRVLHDIEPGESESLDTDQKHTFVAFNDARTFRQFFTVDVSNQEDEAKIFFHIANDEKVEREEEHRDNDHENEQEQEVPPKPVAMAKFVNNFSQNVNVNWINPQSGDEKTVITNLQPNTDESLETHSGHKFVAYNEERTLRQVFVMNVKDGFTEIHKIMGSSRLAEL